MVYRATRLSKGGYVKPSEDIDPQLKQNKPEYSLAMSRFAYSQYMLGRCMNTISDVERIQTLRSYAEGRQDPGLYKDIILGKTTPPTTNGETEWATIFKQRDGMYDVNFGDIFSPAPKYLMNIQGIFDNADFDLEVEATDEHSNTLRNEMKYTDLIEGEYKDFFEYVNLTMDLPSGPKRPIPSNAEELEMFQQMGSYKLAYEVAMGYALKITQELSSDPKVRRATLRDLIISNRGCVFVYSDNYKVVKYKYINIEDLVLENSMEEDGGDRSWGGYVEFMTLADFRAENPQLTEEEVLRYANQFNGVLGNSVDYMLNNIDGTATYDDYRIPVLNLWWKATDSEYITKHVDGRSFPEPYKRNGLRPPKMLDTPNRKTSREAMRRLYHSKWVVDTDYVYDFGICDDIPFDFHSKDVRIPFMYFQIPGKSIVEQMKPVLDNIQLNYLNIQNAIAKAPPPGLKIDIGSVENVSFGNKKVHPLDVIKIYQQTGNMLYRLSPTNPGGPMTINQSPIDQLGSLLDGAIIAGIKSMEMWFLELERITGISQTAVSSIDPGQGLGVSQINLATTNNTLKPLIIGWRSIKSGVGTYAANKIQSIIVNHPKAECPYFDLLGIASYTAIKSAGKFPPASWGVFIKAKMEPATKNALLEAAKAGLAVGKDGVPILSYSDYLFIVDKIENGGSVAAIRAFIAYREQKVSQEAFARAQASMENQGRMTAELTQQKSQSEAQQKAMEYQMEVGKIREQFQADAMLKKLDYEYSKQTPKEST